MCIRDRLTGPAIRCQRCEVLADVGQARLDVGEAPSGLTVVCGQVAAPQLVVSLLERAEQRVDPRVVPAGLEQVVPLRAERVLHVETGDAPGSEPGAVDAGRDLV